MEELKVTMILSDGTKLKNLKVNGTNYVSSTKLTEILPVSLKK